MVKKALDPALNELTKVVTVALAGTELNFTVGRTPLGPTWDLNFDDGTILMRLTLESGYLMAGVVLGRHEPVRVIEILRAVQAFPQARVVILDGDELLVAGEIPVAHGVVPGTLGSPPSLDSGDMLRLMGNIIRAVQSARQVLLPSTSPATQTPSKGARKPRRLA